MDIEDVDDYPDLDEEERAEFERDMAASFDDEEAGRLIDADVALADLRALR